MKKWFASEANRAYLYRVLLAVGFAIAGFGVITQDQLALVAGVLMAVLNILPTANTSTKSGN